MVSLPQLKKWIKRNLNIKRRLTETSMYFVLFLMSISSKYSLKEAATFSGKDSSQFSRFLRNDKLAINQLNRLSKKMAKRLSKKIEPLFKKMPKWKIALIFDSTLQARHSLHTENVQRFNHGYGYVVGHQWTNIILYFNEKLIPLPPIPFYSKNYCNKNGLEYVKESKAIVNYLKELNLEDFIGPHHPESVVVLADSGYDAKIIENEIIKKSWQFIIALGSTHSVCSLSQLKKSKKKINLKQVKTFFKNSRLKWSTIRIEKAGKKKKRMDFRVRSTVVYLNGVREIQLVYSEYKKRPDGRCKYLACSDMRVNTRDIILGYKLRWKIEIFHKNLKMHMGFETIAAHSFEAVLSHVYWIYCTYILLNMLPEDICPLTASLLDRKKIVNSIIDQNMLNQISQRLSRINGVQALKNSIHKVIDSGEAYLFKAA